jgi:carbamoyl-phosphate synthase large subunit
LLRAFREQKEVQRVVTTEIDPLAPGAFSADRCYRVPRSDDPGYLPALERICRQEKVTLLVPLADLDLVRFSRERARFDGLGARVWAAPESTLDVSLDKWLTFQLLEDLHIPTPRTLLLAEAIRHPRLSFPLYLKPRHAGMKSSPRYFFSLIADGHDLDYYTRKLEGQHQDYLLQESLLGSREINVDFFVQNRELKRLVCLYRLKAGDGGGIIRGHTIPTDPRIRGYTEQLVTRLDFLGAANFQAFELGDGRLLVTEINPRFSNSSALVVRPAGVDFYALTLAMIGGTNVEPEFDRHRILAVTSAYEPIVVEASPLVEDGPEALADTTPRPVGATV